MFLLLNFKCSSSYSSFELRVNIFNLSIVSLDHVKIGFLGGREGGGGGGGAWFKICEGQKKNQGLSVLFCLEHFRNIDSPNNKNYLDNKR